MRKRYSLSAAAWSGVLLAAMCAVAGTLETEFTSAVVKDLPIGYRTPLKGPDGKQYTIRNNSDQPVEVQLSALKPFQQEGLKRAHADIPDTSWLTINPASITLPAGKEGKVELHLAVPDDKQYANQKYEVWLLAQAKGGQLGIGLITRIKFNTVEKPVVPPTAVAAPGNTGGATNRPGGTNNAIPQEK